MKKFVCLFIALILMVQPFFVFGSAAESGTPQHIPRIVSIVFDDSGSMFDGVDRWAYTSYAMQAFVAMMGKDDVLHVTYLNNSSANGKVNLGSQKQTAIDNIENTLFGGGTPNKLADGQKALTEEYKNYGTGAKYYLVVLSDGELNNGQGEMASELEKCSNNTRNELPGADFETIYFSMQSSSNINIPGVTGYRATNGDEIVSVLRDISADVMGRTTVNHSVSGGKLTFDLKYPALSIAIFAQRKNDAFSNVKVPVTHNGNSVNYNTGIYFVDTPTKINKNQNYPEIIPQNPPHGFVTLLDNGSSPLGKGSYSIDISSLNLSANDIVVLVEPAVKIGCKYFRGDDGQALELSELKQYLYLDDAIDVEFGLYEMNGDGSLGDKVPDDILPAEYNVTIGDTVLNGNGDNRYTLKMTEEYENKELKIEALIEGYQPFVLREMLGEFKRKPEIHEGFNESNANYDITKPDFQGWIDGSRSVEIPLKSVDDTILSQLSIKVEGYGAIPSGSYASLSNNVRVEGTSIVYSPKFPSDTVYSELPSNITITLHDNLSNQAIASVNLNIRQPKYKFTINNELEGTSLNLGELKSNTKKVAFELQANYDGSENYSPITNFNCEKEIRLAINSGVLTGSKNEQNGRVEFIPVYDSAVNTDVPTSAILSGSHEIYATATVDGIAVESDKVSLSFVGGEYKVVVENPITESFTLDTIKTNNQKITFTILADYYSNGNYGAVEDWDLSIYEKLNISSNDLPGRFETLYDAGGKTIGKAFTPIYDENNNNGIVFTRVAGKVHTISATIADGNAYAETTVEVLPPKYTISVRSEGITLVDVELRDNEQFVSFVISRDGRVLTTEELSGFQPFDVKYSKTQKWMGIDTSVRSDSEGAYVACRPTYDGATFISSSLWNWLCLFKVKKGDMTIDITVGVDTASAKLNVETSELAWIIFFIVIGVLLLVLWISFCFISRMRFTKGKFYTLSFGPDERGVQYKVNGISSVKSNQGALIGFITKLKFMIPYSKRTFNKTVISKKASFVTKRSRYKIFHFKSIPYGVADNAKNFNRGNFDDSVLRAIVNRKHSDIRVSSSTFRGETFDPESADIRMSNGTFLVEKGTANVILFIPYSEAKYLLEKRRKNKKSSSSTSAKKRNKKRWF